MANKGTLQEAVKEFLTLEADFNTEDIWVKSCCFG